MLAKRFFRESDGKSPPAVAAAEDDRGHRRRSKATMKHKTALFRVQDAECFTTAAAASPAPRSSSPPPAPPPLPLPAWALPVCCRWSWPGHRGDKWNVSRLVSPIAAFVNGWVAELAPQQRRLPHLCDHPADVASAGGQQDGVGLFGQLGERRHVLLGHAERGCRVTVLHEHNPVSTNGTPSQSPVATSANCSRHSPAGTAPPTGCGWP